MKQEGDEIIARVKCNIGAMRYWALQYGPYVEVLAPELLRKQLQADISTMAKKYKD